MKKLIYLLSYFIWINIYAQDLNTISTAAPFLTINGNPRTGAMGDINVVSSNFYHDAGLYYNPSLLTNKDKYAYTSISYSPWLVAIVDNLNIFNYNTSCSLDSLNSLGYRFSLFDFGQIYSSSGSGPDIISTSRPYEFSHQLSYARSFNNIAIGATLKYIRSDMDIKYSREDYEIEPINTYALDLGVNHFKTYRITKYSNLKTNFGTSISNFGPRVKYSNDPGEDKLFIPTTLHIGFLLNPEIKLSKYEKLNCEITYQAEKLLVPTPPYYNSTHDTIIKGMDPDISPFKALYQSFYDAPLGMEEEWHEIMHKLGGELRLNFLDIFYIAARSGIVWEHETKGNRKYKTAGLGFGYRGFSIDYRKIFSKENPLDGSWACSFGFTANLDGKIFSFN